MYQFLSVNGPFFLSLIVNLGGYPGSLHGMYMYEFCSREGVCDSNNVGK